MGRFFDQWEALEFRLFVRWWNARPLKDLFRKYVADEKNPKRPA